MDKNKKGSRPYNCQPHNNLPTTISVNKPNLSVTKHDQTLSTHDDDRNLWEVQVVTTVN